MKKPVKIIGVNGSFIRKPASGMGQVSWHFIQQLLKESENFSNVKFIIYLEEKQPTEFDKKLPLENIEFKIIKGWYKRDDLIRKILWEKFWLPKQVRKDKCQTFFSPYQSATVFSEKIKHILFVHDVIPNIFPEYLNNFRKKVYYGLVNKAIKKATRIITNSEFSKKDIVKICKINPDKISVVYLDCDPIFRKEVGESDRIKILNKYNLKLSDKYVFNFGGVDVRKNVERVIKAYGKLASEIKNIPDLVIGGNFNKHLIPLVTDVEEVIEGVVEKYQLDKNLFKTIGFVEQEDLASLYQSAEVFIYPSLYEGFGMPILEGMVSKVPVVTSNTTSIPEVISEQAGYLVDDPTSINEIKIQLQKALEDTSENKQQKIDTAFAESQKFSWKKFTEQITNEILK
jgi:glycosyltransferase involved in cell wall biosynthesis